MLFQECIYIVTFKDISPVFLAILTPRNIAILFEECKSNALKLHISQNNRELKLINGTCIRKKHCRRALLYIAFCIVHKRLF